MLPTIDFNSHLITALVLGLVGSAHCIGMCGGIAASLGIKSHSSHKAGMLAKLFSYNLGRIISYAVLGALLAWVTTRLQGHYSTLTIVFRTIAGLMLVAMGLYIAGWWLGLTKLEQCGHKVWKPIQRIVQPLTQNNSQVGTLVLGLSWGFLPCGLIYSTLIWCSSIAQTSLESALLMFTFGLGTLPAMILVGNAGQVMRHYMQNRSIRSILGILVILMGVWTLAVPLQHLGHHNHGGANTEQTPSADPMDHHAHHHH